MAVVSYDISACEFLYRAACGKAEAEGKEKNTEAQKAGGKA